MGHRAAQWAHFGEAFNITMLATTILIFWGGILALPAMMLLR
jgi:hypothetical protein